MFTCLPLWSAWTSSGWHLPPRCHLTLFGRWHQPQARLFTFCVRSWHMALRSHSQPGRFTCPQQKRAEPAVFSFCEKSRISPRFWKGKAATELLVQGTKRSEYLLAWCTLYMHSFVQIFIFLLVPSKVISDWIALFSNRRQQELCWALVGIN